MWDHGEVAGRELVIFRMEQKVSALQDEHDGLRAKFFSDDHDGLWTQFFSDEAISVHSDSSAHSDAESQPPFKRARSSWEIE